MLRAARLGEKIAQSVLRLNLELKNYKPQVRNLATTRKAGKASVNAAQIMEKSPENQSAFQDEHIINKRKPCVRLMGWHWFEVYPPDTKTLKKPLGEKRERILPVMQIHNP